MVLDLERAIGGGGGGSSAARTAGDIVGHGESDLINLRKGEGGKLSKSPVGGGKNPNKWAKTSGEEQVFFFEGPGRNLSREKRDNKTTRRKIKKKETETGDGQDKRLYNPVLFVSKLQGYKTNPGKRVYESRARL